MLEFAIKESTTTDEPIFKSVKIPVKLAKVDEFRNDRKSSLFWQLTTNKLLMERYKTKNQVYSSKNQGHKSCKVF